MPNICFIQLHSNNVSDRKEDRVQVEQPCFLPDILDWPITESRYDGGYHHSSKCNSGSVHLPKISMQPLADQTTTNNPLP